MQVILGILGSILVASIPGFIALWGSRKKTKADAADTLVGTSLDILEELRKQNKELREQNKELKTQNTELLKQGRDYDKLEEELNQANERIEYLISGIKTLIGQLRKRGINPEFVLPEKS